MVLFPVISKNWKRMQDCSISSKIIVCGICLFVSNCLLIIVDIICIPIYKSRIMATYAVIAVIRFIQGIFEGLLSLNSSANFSAIPDGYCRLKQAAKIPAKRLTPK